MPHYTARLSVFSEKNYVCRHTKCEPTFYAGKTVDPNLKQLFCLYQNLNATTESVLRVVWHPAHAPLLGKTISESICPRDIHQHRSIQQQKDLVYSAKRRKKGYSLLMLWAISSSRQTVLYLSDCSSIMARICYAAILYYYALHNYSLLFLIHILLFYLCEYDHMPCKIYTGYEQKLNVILKSLPLFNCMQDKSLCLGSGLEQ